MNVCYFCTDALRDVTIFFYGLTFVLLSFKRYDGRIKSGVTDEQKQSTPSTIAM